MKTKYWIMKSEPSEFSIDDLAKRKKVFWDGVRNYQVRNMFRDEFSLGDKGLFYHSSTKEIGVVGEIEIIQTASVDKTQFNPKSKYYDPKSSKDNPRWFGPTVKFVNKFNRTVTLNELKENNVFSDLPLVKKGNRLSVIPITKKHYDYIVKLGSKTS